MSACLCGMESPLSNYPMILLVYHLIFLTHHGQSPQEMAVSDPFGRKGPLYVNFEYGFPGEDRLMLISHFLLNPVPSLFSSFSPSCRIVYRRPSFFPTAVTHYYLVVSSHSLISFRWFFGA